MSTAPPPYLVMRKCDGDTILSFGVAALVPSEWRMSATFARPWRATGTLSLWMVVGGEETSICAAVAHGPRYGGFTRYPFRFCGADWEAATSHNAVFLYVQGRRLTADTMRDVLHSALAPTQQVSAAAKAALLYGFELTTAELRVLAARDKDVALAALTVGVPMSDDALFHTLGAFPGDGDVARAVVHGQLRWRRLDEVLTFAARVTCAEVMMRLVELHPDVLLHAAARFAHDRDVAAAAVYFHAEALRHVAPHLRADRVFVRFAVAFHGEALAFAADALRADAELVCAAVRNGALSLFHDALPTECVHDRTFVLCAITRDKTADTLALVEEPFRSDREIVLAAVAVSASNFRFAAEELRGCKSFVLEVVRQHPHAYVHVSAALKDDKDVTLAAVAQDWTLLQHAPAAMRGDADVISAVLLQDADVLALASDALWTDATFVRMVCETYDTEKLARVPHAVWRDRELVLAVMATCAYVFFYADAALVADKLFVTEAVAQNPDVLPLTSFRGDKDVVLTAVRRNWTAVMTADGAMRGDKDVALAAVVQHWNALEEVSPALRCDPEVVLAALTSGAGALAHADPALLADEAFALTAVTRDGRALEHILCRTPAVVTAAVAQNGRALRWRTHDDDALVRLALRTRRCAALDVPPDPRWERAGPKQVAFLLRRTHLPWEVVVAHILPHFAHLDD